MACQEAENHDLILEALRLRRPVSLNIVRWLLARLSAIGAIPHPLEERRTVARLDCDFQVVLLLQGDRALGGRVTDISLFGLNVEVAEELARGSRMRLMLAHDESMEEVGCRVAGCSPHGVAWSCRLVYDQDAESLSRSWVCALLREMGYDLNHLHQRRAFIRVKTDLPVRIECSEGILVGRVVDLGVGGALVHCEKGLLDQGEVRVHFDPPGEEPFSLEALPLPRREEALQCLQFSRPSHSQYERLGHYVRAVIESLAKVHEGAD